MSDSSIIVLSSDDERETKTRGVDILSLTETPTPASQKRKGKKPLLTSLTCGYDNLLDSSSSDDDLQVRSTVKRKARAKLDSVLPPLPSAAGSSGLGMKSPLTGKGVAHAAALEDLEFTEYQSNEPFSLEPGPVPSAAAPKTTSKGNSVDKELKARLKSLEKERKEREIAEQRKLKKLNKKRDKKETASEIICKFNDPFLRNYPDLSSKLWQLLEEAAFTVQTIETPSILVDSDNQPYPSFSISYHRKIDRRFDDQSKSFIPASEKVLSEPFLLFYWDANTLAQFLVSSPEDKNILYVQRSKWSRLFPNHRFVHIIEGWEKYSRKIKQAETQSFRTMVRAMDVDVEVEGTSSGSGKTRRRGGKNASSQKAGTLDLELAKDLLLEWELEPSVAAIIYCKNEEEVLEFMLESCYQVGHKPYIVSHETEKVHFGIFANAKSGSTLRDTWKKMLETINLISDVQAEAIVRHYPTMTSLMQAYYHCDNKDKADVLLENIQSLAANGKRIGQAKSRCIHRVLMATDPNKLYLT